MNQTMTYEKLYDNMVKNFTVENDNKDYTLGDYMLMKAKAKRNALTVTAEKGLAVASESKGASLSTFFAYVGEKLKIKKAPVKDKTMRRFPLRTSLTALCSATIVCALVVCCAVFGLSSSKVGMENIVAVEENDAEIEAFEIEETVSSDNFEII